MPRLQLDLAPISAARRQTDAAARALRAADGEVAVARTALAVAQRDGAGRTELQRLASKVDEAGARRTRARKELRERRHLVSGIAEGLLAQLDPARLVESLDARVPLALLPIRIETRFQPAFPDDPDRLCIRVYPDDLHILEHVAALTTDEKRGGAEYWSARYARGDAERVLRDLATVFGSDRAAFIVRVMTPTNALPAEGASAVPEFPGVELIDARAKVSRAVLLPDRWCAIGYGPGRKELFRVWGKRIPDELPLSPDWLATAKDAAERGDERDWLVDFDKALAVGMALKITQAELGGGTRLADLEIERLLVVGVDWTKDSAASAAELAAVLGAHRDAEGLSFLPLGTPTNNTTASPAGYGSAASHAPPTLAVADPKHRDALQLLNWALGLDGNSLTAEGIGNAHMAEQRTAMHMLNVLWRGTFGEYLLEQWAPVFDEENLGTNPLYGARSYALAYLRPTGALPLLRIGRQPYGVLPVVGKAFRTSASPVEALVDRLLGVLRPMWEIALQNVPTLSKGAIEKAQQVLQTAPWSQAAYYRDRDPNPVCRKPNPFADVDLTLRDALLKSLLKAGDIDYPVHLTYCSDFKPQPPYRAEPLAGVPWVLADAQDARLEAASHLQLPTDADNRNYLSRIADEAVRSREQAAPYLLDRQGGPSLLEALVAFSVQKEQGDSVTLMALDSGAVLKEGVTLGTTRMPHVEALAETTTSFTIQTPKDLARVVLVADNPATRALSFGDKVAAALDGTYALRQAAPQLAAVGLEASVAGIAASTRNLAGVKLSLDYLSSCTVGELNIALRSTLDCFSYRLDAWFTARANRRLEQLRTRTPQGLYTGGFAWVENLKRDRRPDSDGHLLAPSIGQAATAAILRSGYSSNLDSGAFDIRLDSHRTSRAAALLQGLARDQPLAALYGYRIERGLRDAGRGRLIWPLRRAFPWRPAGERPQDESAEEIGARDVVDGAAVLDLWEEGAGDREVRNRLKQALDGISQGEHQAAELKDEEWSTVQGILRDVADLADSVADLLMAEGAHQIVHGNLERAAAAIAVADKQSLPPELEFPSTPRGGAGYTQRLVALCPAPEQESPWPEDIHARAEPAVNAWLARMLGDPRAYRFTATVKRPGIPDRSTSFTLRDLSISPLRAVLVGTAPTRGSSLGTDATGLRELLVRTTLHRLGIPAAELESEAGAELQIGTASAARLGLGELESLASLLRAVLDHARPATRRDLVSLRGEFEAAKKDPKNDEAEFLGVDHRDLDARVRLLIKDLKGITSALKKAETLAELEKQLIAAEAYLPRSSWPAQVLEAQADAFENDRMRKAAFKAARTAVAQVLTAKAAEAAAPAEKIDGQEPNRGQTIRRHIEAIRQLLGKDFPVVPRFTLGAYASEYSASLKQQDQLSAGQPWAVHHWLEQLACVRDGAGHLSSLLAARDALHGPAKAKDFAVVQLPHVPEQIWAARPEAWVNPPAGARDDKDPPEELEAFLEQGDRKAHRDIHRVVPDIAIALHAFGGPATVGQGDFLTGLVCDDWPEFVPDRYQTAAIGFHYDAPGARPPQSILLAMPPELDQEAWTFEHVLDVINETFDLAKLRAVRPRDLGGGLGALLPASYLPQSYTDDEPGVGVLKLRERALVRLQGAEAATQAFPLGKV